jgi:hypothetical protein
VKDYLIKPLPDNTLPMMTGLGQFGPIEMGGMTSVVKVREGLAANDYSDPGWYKHPPGTIAYEVQDQAGEAPRQKGHAGMKMSGMEMQARSPRPRPTGRRSGAISRHSGR